MAASTSAPDDFEAVRAVVEALKPFAADDQRRILRWAQEKLGLTSFAGSVPTVSAAATALSAEERPVPPGRSRDIRSFLDGKKPSNDVQFAAAVAYYHAFEAAEHKLEISPSDLLEAARLSGRFRLKRPITTLHNAVQRGYLDKGGGRGSFRINTVGENLVAMAMPGSEVSVRSTKPRAQGSKAKKTKTGT